MFKKSAGICLLFFMTIIAKAQDFAGYRSGNYTGVNGVFFNPANIADSRYRFDFNLFAISGFVGNDKAKFSLKNIANSLNVDSIKNQLFGENAGTSSGFVSTSVHGPSLMFNVGQKSSIALTTRARVLANVMDMDGKLIDKISDDFNNDPALPYTISSSEDMRFSVNGWTEFGLSFGRVLHDGGKHFLKGGLSVKYLAGAGNGYLNVANFKGTLNSDMVQQDVYMSNSTGRLAVGFGGIRISDLEVSDVLKMESTGFGGDIGFVYEFRPDHEKFTSGDEKKSQRGANKYKLKVGVALLDLGKISYDRDLQRSGSYDINITGNERLYFNELNNVEIDDYKTYFNSRPQYFTPDNSNNESSYSVSLPSTLQLDLDYHLNKNLYVNLASQLAVGGKDKIFNNQYYNAVTVTPRYEGKGFGLYVPVNYNALTNFNAGTSFRFGPLFLGSGSVLSALFGDSKQVDVHVGLRFGGLQK